MTLEQYNNSHMSKLKPFGLIQLAGNVNDQNYKTDILI